MPPTRARPDVGITRVVSMLAVVVLPAPFGPSSPKISPWNTVRFMPSTAVTPPGYTFVRSVVWITSAAPGVSPLLLTTTSHDSGAAGRGRAVRFAHERAAGRHRHADVLRHR